MSTTVSEPTMLRDEERFEVTCSCAGACTILAIVTWDGDKYLPAQTSFDFYTANREDTWRSRFRSAWLTLRGKGGFYHGIVMEPAQAEELGAWLLNRSDGDG